MLDKSLPWRTLVQFAISYGTSVHPVRSAYLLGGNSEQFPTTNFTLGEKLCCHELKKIGILGSCLSFSDMFKSCFS